MLRFFFVIGLDCEIVANLEKKEIVPFKLNVEQVKIFKLKDPYDTYKTRSNFYFTYESHLIFCLMTAFTMRRSKPRSTPLQLHSTLAVNLSFAKNTLHSAVVWSSKRHIAIVITLFKEQVEKLQQFHLISTKVLNRSNGTM